MHVLGGFFKRLVISGATVYIRLLRPSGILYCYILAHSGKLAKLGDSWPGCYAQRYVFLQVCSVLLLDILYLVHQCTFRRCGSLNYCIFGQIYIDTPLYMYKAMKKGTENFFSMILLVWCIYWHIYFIKIWLNHLGLLLEALPSNIEVAFMVCL